MRNLLSLAAVAASLGLAAAADLPVITLPWGKYQAEVYERDEQIYVFRNVRFGAQPKRFAAPAFPDWTSDEIQDSKINTTCFQVDPAKLANPPGGPDPVEDPLQPFAAQTEDCLFVDIYAPVWVFEEKNADVKLPVVNWIYGGGYAFGNKDPGGALYTGQPVLESTGYEAIFVAGNYRTGAFGWLAGDYMQKVGQPNAGLYDQALLLDWIQEHIGQVYGDKEKVSAWGESAGAGSILHHLTREDGTKDPKFISFVAQSPGFEWAWDNSPGGKLDTMYRNFSRLAGCEFEFDIACLRKADIGKLASANQDLYDLVRQTGLFPVGPAVDGKWIKTLSTIAISEGKIWKDNIESAIITHVANEGSLFSPKDMTTKAKYEAFLAEFLPGEALAPQREAIQDKYKCNILNYRLCVAKIIAHAVFICNTRDLVDSYPDRSYAMEYEFPGDGAAVHGSDLIPEFMRDADDAYELLKKTKLDDTVAKLYAGMLEYSVRRPLQQYLGSFAVAGDPNTMAPPRPYWPRVEVEGDALQSVLQARMPGFSAPAFGVVEDQRNTKSNCQFWTGLAKEIVGDKETSAADGAERMKTQGKYPSGMESDL